MTPVLMLQQHFTVLKFATSSSFFSIFSDIRVPLMIRGPGIASKTQPGPAVITLDMAPTLIDMAGLNYLDYGMDGISLLPMLKGQNEAEYSEREFLIEYHGEGGNGNAPACQVKFISKSMVHQSETSISIQFVIFCFASGCQVFCAGFVLLQANITKKVC